MTYKSICLFVFLQQFDIKTLLQDESIQITVGNDKFRNPLHTRNSVYPSTVSQNSGLPTSKTSVHAQHRYAEETASVARAKEMVMQTQEMLSKLAGLNPASLRLKSVGISVESPDGPKAINTSNSAHAKLDTSSKIARTILQNVDTVAAAFCPKESGVSAWSRYANPGSSAKAASEDEERYLYGKEPDARSLPFGQSDCTAGSVYGRSSVTWPPIESREMEAGCDPVVADMLKSIGFNVELSKLMSDKAKRECEEDKNNLQLIRRASLFLAKQLEDVKGLDCSGKDLTSLENVTGVVVNKDARSGRILSNGPKEKERILYDDFSNSDDEFCRLEKKMKVAASSNDPGPQPPKAMIRNNSAAVVTLPLNLSFPTRFPVFSAPTVVLPISPAVLPPLIPIPPPQIILPPSSLQHQPLPQQTIWSGFHMPSGARTLPRKITVLHPCNEEEWEHTADDFLRKLQEPRTVGAPSKQIPKEVVPESSLQSSSDSERADRWKRMQERRDRQAIGREKSESPKQIKRGKCSHRDSDEQFEDDDADGPVSVKRRCLKSLRNKLQSMKKKHNILLRMQEKSNRIKDKLALNERLQCGLMDKIEELKKITRHGDHYNTSDEEVRL